MQHENNYSCVFGFLCLVGDRWVLFGFLCLVGDGWVLFAESSSLFVLKGEGGNDMILTACSTHREILKHVNHDSDNGWNSVIVKLMCNHSA